jgi:hypothetical protein
VRPCWQAEKDHPTRYRERREPLDCHLNHSTGWAAGPSFRFNNLSADLEQQLTERCYLGPHSAAGAVGESDTLFDLGEDSVGILGQRTTLWIYVGGNGMPR